MSGEITSCKRAWAKALMVGFRVQHLRFGAWDLEVGVSRGDWGLEVRIQSWGIGV